MKLSQFLSESSKAAEDAKKRGLISAKWGWWKDKTGKLVARTKNGELVFLPAKSNNVPASSTPSVDKNTSANNSSSPATNTTVRASISPTSIMATPSHDVPQTYSDTLKENQFLESAAMTDDSCIKKLTDDSQIDEFLKSLNSDMFEPDSSAEKVFKMLASNKMFDDEKEFIIFPPDVRNPKNIDAHEEVAKFLDGGADLSGDENKYEFMLSSDDLEKNTKKDAVLQTRWRDLKLNNADHTDLYYYQRQWQLESNFSNSDYENNDDQDIIDRNELRNAMADYLSGKKSIDGSKPTVKTNKSSFKRGISLKPQDYDMFVKNLNQPSVTIPMAGWSAKSQVACGFLGRFDGFHTVGVLTRIHSKKPEITGLHLSEAQRTSVPVPKMYLEQITDFNHEQEIILPEHQYKYLGSKKIIISERPEAMSRNSGRSPKIYHIIDLESNDES